MDRVEIAHELLSLSWGCTISDVCQIISFYTTICLTSMFILFLDYETKHEPSTYKLFSLSKVHYPLTRIIVGDERCLKKNIFEKKIQGANSIEGSSCNFVFWNTRKERERDFPYLKLWTNINCCKKQRW